jgi:hypothetical protein
MSQQTGSTSTSLPTELTARWSKRDGFILVGTLLALLPVLWFRGLLSPLPDLTAYNAQINARMVELPSRFPELISVTSKPPQAAFDLLKPNVLDARQWTDPITNSSFDVLVIHSSEGRDMLGHFPPNCYPGSGFQLVNSTPRPIDVQGTQLQGIEYEFIAKRFDGPSAFRVFNVMLLPNQEQARNMEELYTYMGKYAYRNMGSGQLQIRVPISMPEAERLAIYTRAIQMYFPVIQAIQARPDAVKTQVIQTDRTAS